MKRIELAKGLEISLEVLKRLKKRKDLNADINVGTFTNCREVGLTFAITGYYEGKTYKPLSINDWFTFCVYEHRNSDDITINGKQGYINHNGDLPYIADSKWSYLASSGYKQYNEATDKLVELINKVIKGETITAI